MTNQNVLLNTVERIFANNQSLARAGKFILPKNRKAKNKELELALTVILVDLASCDQNFEPGEYQIILNGLRRMFGTTREEVQSLVNQATLVLRNLRGTNRFAQLLRDELSDEERIVIMEIIDEVINVDGSQDGFEVYLKQRLSDLLGVSAPAKKSSNPS